MRLPFRAGAAALSLIAAPGALPGADLVVLDASGRALARADAPDGRWCLVWNHSVTGIEVADCFRAEAGVMVLEASHQPDFAAGLGEVPGRGRAVSDGAGGYRIEAIGAVMPDGLALRRGGPAVNHRLRIGGEERPLPGRPGERLTLRLEEG